MTTLYTDRTPSSRDETRRGAPRSLLADGNTRPGRVLRQDEAIELGRELLSMVRSQSLGIRLEHTARAVSTVLGNEFQEWTVGDELYISFYSMFGSGWPVGFSTNQFNAAAIKRLVRQSASLLPPPPATAEPENPDDPKYFTFNERPFIPVSLWKEPTARALDTPASDVLTALVDPVQRAGQMASATAVIETRAILYMYQPGLTAWCHETDSELTLTSRTPDGKRSAWAGQAARDWSRLTPASIAAEAIALIDKSENPVAVEPGRRTVILSHVAVAQLLRFMAPGFTADRPDCPFYIPADEGGGHKLGQKVFDERIRMVSDPRDPDGGFVPFYEIGGLGSPGLPIPEVTWINGGVLTDLAYGMPNSTGRRWNELPHSVRLEAMPGTKTATVDAMIAGCDEGIYITRFGGLSVVDNRSGLMTGVTTDGCFLVKNGRIERAVKDFRFLDSPFHAFNRLLMIGTAARAALGNDSLTMDEYYACLERPPQGRWSRWPRSPIIAPPMMIRDFNLSALADAV